MKFIVCTLALLGLTTAPSVAEPVLGPNAKDNPNVAVALGYIDAVWVRHDPVAGFEEFVASDSVHYPGRPGGSNPNGLAKFLEGFPAFKYNVKQVFADGDYVIVHSYLTGVPMTGEMVQSPVPGVTPQPKLADEVVDIYQIIGGKIAHHWDIIEPATQAPEVLFGSSPSKH